MRWMSRAAGLILASLASSAVAQEGAKHLDGALGFRGAKVQTVNAAELGVTAPLGGRWWFSGQRLGIDVGFGVATHKQGSENLTAWSVEGGVPICAKSWDRVHVLFRPGVNYASQQGLETATGPKITDKFVTVTGEIETEVFLVDNVSISASHGVGIVYYKPGESGGKSTTDFTTFGDNFTSLGFHVYLFGGK